MVHTATIRTVQKKKVVMDDDPVCGWRSTGTAVKKEKLCINRAVKLYNIMSLLCQTILRFHRRVFDQQIENCTGRKNDAPLPSFVQKDEATLYRFSSVSCLAVCNQMSCYKSTKIQKQKEKLAFSLCEATLHAWQKESTVCAGRRAPLRTAGG